MKKMAAKALRPDTLIKKCVYGICGAAIVLLLAAGSMMSDFAYYLLKPRLEHTYSVLVSSVATQISYILHQNTQYLLKFALDEELMELTQAYLEGAGDVAGTGTELSDQVLELEEKIEALLVPENRGSQETGAILSTRQAFLVGDWEYYLGSQELAPYAEEIMASGWYQGLPDTMEELPETYGEDFLRCYAPVFSGENTGEPFLAYGAGVQVGSHDLLIMMVEPFSEFQALFEDLEEAGVEDYALMGYKDEILFSSHPESVFSGMTSEERGDLFQEGQYELKLTESGKNSILGVRLSYRIEELKLAVCLSRADLLRPYQAFFRMSNGLLVIFTFLLVAAVILILWRVLRRIRGLAGQMQEVRQGNYQVNRSIRGRDEVSMLADTFYQMMDEIQSNMETMRQREERERQMEYSLLVSQIDPHFIYNTMNTITYLAQLNRTEDIMVINRALTGLLRDRLRISRLQIFDTVEKEREQIEDYVTIQKYLCSNGIHLDFEISGECGEVRYPKNVLQPFVENSILHGIVLHRDEQGKLIPGRILISIVLDGEWVVTRVRDNGTGMEEDQLHAYFERDPREAGWMAGEEDTHEHIGIFNIRMRMALLYGEKFQIQGENLPEGGLEICFRFPRGDGQAREFVPEDSLDNSPSFRETSEV